MILYEDDWNRYPTAVPDYTTSNTSWLKTSKLLKDMKISNNKFMLALIDQRLLDIDPHSESLSLEEQSLVIVEIKLNPWYFFREVARVPSEAGAGNNPFRMNRSVLSMYWLFFNHVTSITIQPRQTGKTMGSLNLANYLMNVLCENTSIKLLTQDDKLRTETIENLRELDTELPSYITKQERFDSRNSHSFTVNRLGNKYTGHVPSQSPKQANRVGRGLTSPIFFIDEPPTQANIKITMAAALPGISAAAEEANSKNEPYGIIMTTTAGMRDDRDGKFVYKLTMDSAKWTEKMLDCKDLDTLENVVVKNSRNKTSRVNCTYNHKQLGKTDSWLKRVIRLTTSTGQAMLRDFFNIWTSGTASHPLSAVLLSKLKTNVNPSLYDEITELGYIMNWYIDEDDIEDMMTTEKTVVSLDTSDAIGSDDIALTISRLRDGFVLGVGVYNETNLITFSELLFRLIKRWEYSTWIIERKSSAIVIIDYLLLMMDAEGMNPFERIYNTVVQERNERPERFNRIAEYMKGKDPELHIKFKSSFGFNTSGGTGITSRNILYSTTLSQGVKSAYKVMNDYRLIDQILGLVIKNGRVDHSESGNDDLVISWLLGRFFMTRATNLDYYGINPNLVLSEVSKPKVKLSKKESRIYNEQQLIRKRLRKLTNKMVKTSNPYIERKIEVELRMLESKLILEDTETFNLNSVLERIREKKKIETKRQSRF